MRRPTIVKFLIVIAWIALGGWFLLSPSIWTTEAASDGRGYELPFSEELAELGDRIFDDQNLSIGRNQACNTCHASAWGFTGPDPNINLHGAVYPGSIPGRFGDRRPPSSAYSTISPVFHFSRKAGGQFVGGNFWDGRATGERLGNPASEQAQGPFLNPVEQGLRDSACVVYRVAHSQDYGVLYRELWGNDIDTIVYPADIDTLCEAEGPRFNIDAVNREKIEQQYDNIAISIAVYEESHNLYSSKFDAWRKGQAKFTAEERQGFALFQGKANCASCHTTVGQQPGFTGQTFENLGVPANPDNPIYTSNPNFVDIGLAGFLATRDEWQEHVLASRGKMRVPTLRNVDLRPYPTATKAYMHNGVFKSLEEVVHFYNTRDLLPYCEAASPRSDWGVTCWPAPEVPENMNVKLIGNLGLTTAEEAALVAFLKTLSDGFLPEPGSGKFAR
ncbi:MAG TPA: cytochrome c peroxidase [Pyrinomonadaceae bacterium]|nr:cytochrome c peroxidase [Pyrinomonadaceae bacterium]